MTTNHAELDDCLEHYTRFRGVSARMLQLAPPDRLDYKPFQTLRTLGEQFLHIAQVADFYSRGLFDHDWNFARISPPPFTPTHAMLQEKLANNLQYVTERFASFPLDQINSKVAVPNIPAEYSYRWWFLYLVQHEIHHKAQIAIYLRELQIKPPFFAVAFPGDFRPDIRA
ncbi:MAG: DinB family protein [Planctomycetota bacterium]